MGAAEIMVLWDSWLRGGVAESDWANVLASRHRYLLPTNPGCCVDRLSWQPIVLQKSFCVVDHKISEPSHDLALNSPVTSVIGLESPLLAVLACLGFSRKNHRSAFSDFCNTIGPKQKSKFKSVTSVF